jgi:hypothetical protein
MTEVATLLAKFRIARNSRRGRSSLLTHERHDGLRSFLVTRWRMIDALFEVMFQP